MAYTAEIQIAVKGAKELRALQAELDKSSKAVDRLNRDIQTLSESGIPRSINNLNKLVAEAAESFNKVALGTSEAATTAKDYYQANKLLNNSLRERLKLLSDIKNAERGTVLANIQASQAARRASGFGMFSAGVESATATQKAIRRKSANLSRKPKVSIEATPLMLPAYQERGLQILDNSVKLNESQLRIERALNGERARGVRFLEKQSAEEARQVDLGIKAQRTNMLGGVPVGAMPSSAQYAGQSVGPRAAPGTALAAGLQGYGMPNFAAGVRGIGQGLTPGRRAGTLKGAVGSAIIGGGFPLLFGQGPEAAIGGAAGGLLGGLIGGPMGFALSIAGTAIGEIFAKQKELTEEVRNEAVARGQVYATMQQQIDSVKLNLKAQAEINALAAQEQAAIAEGNKELAIRLQLQQQLIQIDRERIAAIREKVADPNVAPGAQMQEVLSNINGEARLAEKAAKRLAIQQQLTAEYQKQVGEIRHAAALEQKNVEIAQNQVSKFATLAQAHSQAEITVNNALLQRLNYELQGTTNAQDRVKIARKIYQVELANARATYEATRLQIQAQIIQVALEQKAQELKAETLQVELAQARQKKQDTKELERALQLQGKAIAMARDNVFLTGAIAIEQRRGAEATFKAAEFAAKVNFEQNAVAKASAETASSTGVIANNLNVAAAGAGVLRDSTQGAAVAAAEYAENIRKAAVNSAQMVKANLVQLAQQARAASRVGLKQEGEGPAGPAVNTATYARGGYSLGALSDKFLGRAFSERGGSSDTIFMSYVQKIKQLEAIKRYEEDLAAYKEYQKYGIDVPKPVVPLAARSYAKRGGMTAYAEGGFVTRPTNALIGEGGEAEYVIPASKMSEAMARYSAGARGSSVIPDGVNPQVNITTGPITQMNGTNYVTQRDLMYATETAAREGAAIALKSLRSNPATRRSVGLAR